jgi:hypothetical protein
VKADESSILRNLAKASKALVPNSVWNRAWKAGGEVSGQEQQVSEEQAKLSTQKGISKRKESRKKAGAEPKQSSQRIDVLPADIDAKLDEARRMGQREAQGNMPETGAAGKGQTVRPAPTAPAAHSLRRIHHGLWLHATGTTTD